MSVFAVYRVFRGVRTTMPLQSNLAWRQTMPRRTGSYDHKMNYLPTSVVCRCALRRQYRMPEDIDFQDKSERLALEEMPTFPEECLLREGGIWCI